MDSLLQVFPLYGLEIRTQRLSLRLMTVEEISSLALRSREKILPEEGRGWMGSWTQLSRPEYETKFFQYYLQNIAEWRPDNWILNLGVFLKKEEEAIGSLGIEAEAFSVTQTAKTGSWLLRDFQGKGYGREIREAALFFIFKTLGAAQARSGADPENEISIKISSSLGYQQDGTEEWPDGSIKKRFLLQKADWQERSDIEVLDFESCRDFFLPKKYPHHAPL